MVAGFPRSDGNIRFDVFEWAAVENERIWNVEDLTRRFAIPMGMHLIILKFENITAAGINYEIFFDLRASQTAQNEFMEVGGVNEYALRPRHDVVLGQTNLDLVPKVYNVEVFENITFHKADDTDGPIFTIYFAYLPGPMNWMLEWAALMRQRRNIAKLTTAGRKFHQVGNYHVLRRYNLL